MRQIGPHLDARHVAIGLVRFSHGAQSCTRSHYAVANSVRVRRSARHQDKSAGTLIVSRPISRSKDFRTTSGVSQAIWPPRTTVAIPYRLRTLSFHGIICVGRVYVVFLNSIKIICNYIATPRTFSSTNLSVRGVNSCHSRLIGTGGYSQRTLDSRRHRPVLINTTTRGEIDPSRTTWEKSCRGRARAGCRTAADG